MVIKLPDLMKRLQIFDNSWIVGKIFKRSNYIKLIFSWGLESKSIYRFF